MLESNELLKVSEKKHPEMYTNGYPTIIRQFESSGKEPPSGL